MKASVVKTAVSKLTDVETFILTSTSTHSADRMLNPSVDIENEILTYTDKRTEHVYVVDCNDINMIVYKPGTTL